jgi:dihydrofolate reductase
MGTIVISENITLDGVIEDPTGEEGFEQGGWFSAVGEADHHEWAQVESGEADRAEALLLGRRTYEWLAARWLTRTGTWAERLAAMPKYVVSSTLAETPWPNTTVLDGDVLDQVRKLREQLDGEIVVNGSGRLARALLEHDLVDELRLMVYPSAVGAGDRLFPSTGNLRLELVSARRVGTSLAMVTYRLGG